MNRASTRILAGVIIALSSSFISAQANDRVILDSARDAATGQAWFNYLSQCLECDDRREALGQLQLMQYLAAGEMKIEGAASETAGAADSALLARARSSNEGQDWYNYLAQCSSCDARGEALGVMQQLQLAANGNLTIAASALSGSATSGALARPNISLQSGDEESLLDAALIHGNATNWYSYLVSCKRCEQRTDALNAMQQLQYASAGNAFDSELSWVPGESGLAQTSAEANANASADVTGATTAAGDNDDELMSAEFASENTSAQAHSDNADNNAQLEEPSPEELMAGGNIAFNSVGNDPTEDDYASQQRSGQAERYNPDTSMGFDASKPAGDSWELALEISGHSRAVWRVSFSPSAPLLASASGDRTVLLYDLSARDIKHRLSAHQGYVNAIAFSPNGQQIASGGGDQAVIIWDVDSGAAMRILQGHAGDINALAWSASGNLLVSAADDGRVLVWDVSSGKRIAEMAETGSDVTALAISPNEQTVATAGSNGQVYLFNTKTGAQQSSLDSHDGYTFGLAWDVAGQQLTAAGSDGLIRQWQTDNGNLAGIAAQQKHTITAINFSANGKYLASSGFDGKVVIRDATSFAQLQSIKAYPGSAYSVSMSGDGRFMAAAGGVNFIRVWRR